MLVGNGWFSICICPFVVVEFPPKDVSVYNQSRNHTEKIATFWSRPWRPITKLRNTAVDLLLLHMISFIMLSVICRSVKRICGSHLRNIASLGNTASFNGMLPRWGAFCSTVFNSSGPRFESQTFCFRDERVTARATGKFLPQNILVDHIISIVFIASWR